MLISIPRMVATGPGFPPVKNIPVAIVEILLVFLALYAIFRMVRGTRGAGVVKGLVVALVVAFTLLYTVATAFQLEAITYLLSNFVLWSVIAAVVIFQPEIRRGLTHIGRYPMAWRSGTTTGKTLREVTNAVLSLAGKRIGALIAIEQNVGLGDYAEGGVPLDAEVSAPLLETIFYEGTQLHDGAVIIQNGRISAAGCFLPLTESELKHTFGTRHRAGLGLSEETDALVLIISEQSGSVRIAFNGRLTGVLGSENLLTTLENMFGRGLRKGQKATEQQGEPDEDKTR